MRKFCRILVVDSLRQISASFTAVSIVFAAILLLSTTQRAHAATYTVCPLPADCNFQTPDAAVNDPDIVGGDIIDIITDNYVLGATMQVDSSITINGNGSTLDANNNRALNVSGTSSVVTVNDVNIFNGQDTGEGSGGAIRVIDGAQLILNRAIIENNSANDSGGGLSNSDSIVDIFDSTFIGNYADFSGGAIRTWGANAVTNLTRTNIDSNQSGVVGGGIATANGGTINVFESTITNNVALNSSVIIDNITVPLASSNNCGASPYGQTFLAGAGAISGFSYRIRAAGPDGILNELIVPGRLRKDGPLGPLLATVSTIIPAGLPAGEELILEFVLDTPIAMDPLATYAIETEKVGNYGVVYTLAPGSYEDGQAYSCSTDPGGADYDFQILGGTPGDGGGAYSDGTIALTNSTLSGNVGDGGFASAPITGDNTVSAEFSTVVNNSGNGLTAEAGNPGGVISFGGSILAGNNGSDCFGDDSGALAISADFNLIGDISGCQSIVLQTNDLAGGPGSPIIDPLLGILQDNGGSTFTHALDPNSPAVDAGGACHLLPDNPLLNDQRGSSRPQAGACDIGSFEYAPPLGPLQTLINAAAPGTTINVPDGTYAEPIIIGDGKTLSGSGPDNVVIDASNLGVSAITATGDFTLENIQVTNGHSLGNGGGIFANIAGTDIALNNVVFDNNDADSDGGAIYLPNGTLTATNIIVTNSDAGGDGGGIFSGAATTIIASLFESNSAVSAGGAIFNDGNMSITDTTVSISSAAVGGGIYNNGPGDLLYVTGSTFSDNTASNTGVIAGGAIGGAGTMEIRNSTLSGNATSGNGGGIGLTGGTALLNNVTLAFNVALAGFGGAFYADFTAFISLSNSLLSDNDSFGSTNCSNVISLGYNLFDLAPCDPADSDITAEPLINFLAPNGGPTQTHALQRLSPARDAADPGQLAIELGSALSAEQLSYNGVATESGGNLVPVSGEFVAGSIYASAPDEGPFDLNGSFSTQFSFQITDLVACCGESSGDGFTFAIAANPSVLGEVGGRLGVATSSGPLGTVSVEFDTWGNGGDISGNAIGINVGGFVISDYVVSAAQTAIPGEFDDGNIWTAWIEYRSDTHRLDVRVAADGVRPDLPQLTHVVDIAAEVGATGYYGFTGGTGTAYATHMVTDWEFFITNCPSFDQRGDPRPKGVACDIGAYEAQTALELDSATLRTVTVGEHLPNGISYPGVVDVPIIEIPIEKLTGDSFSAPESAPLGSFPLGSFPIGSFDLQSSPLGSFPLGSFPIGSFPIGSFPLGSFPIGSFPLSSIPLQAAGGWAEILSGIPELAGAPLQTVTFEQLLTHSSFPSSVAGIELRDLSIQDSPLGSFSLPGLSLGETTVAELDQWAVNAGETETVCTTLNNEDSTFIDCGADDTLLSLEYKGAPVSSLSLSSLPLGSFPIGSFPLGSFPIGLLPLGSFPIGSFPLGSFPIGSFPLGSFPIGSFPLGSFNLLAAPTASLPLGSFPIGSFPLGSFEVDGKTFCEFYDDQADLNLDPRTCTLLSVNESTDSLADLIVKLADSAGNLDISSTPLGSFPMGSFQIDSLPIGSFPIGSFDLANPPLSELTLEDFDGCQKIDGTPDCSSSPFSPASTLNDVVGVYGSLAASPLGSFPLGSFNIADMPLGSFPIGSFPLGSFKINGTPLGSFPLGSFDLVTSPLGSFPLGSFSSDATLAAVVNDPTGLCVTCQNLTDAELAGAIKSTATLYDLAGSSEFATTTFGEVLNAMSLAMLYGPGTLADIENTGNLTLGQLLISMMLKTDFPWETISLEQLDAQEFSADNFVSYAVDIVLQGTELEPFAVEVTLDDSFLYLEDSSALVVISDGSVVPTLIDDPVIVDNEDETQTLFFDLNLGGFTTNSISFATVPAIALGNYAATAMIRLGTDDPVPADNSNASVTVIPDPLTDPLSIEADPVLAPPDVLYLGFIDTPDDNDFFAVQGQAGSRVAVFMSNPAGDNDLIMYEPSTTVEAKGQTAESPALDSVPFEDDGVDYQSNLTEEPNALEDVNLATVPLASISTNRGDADESVSAIAGDNEPFIIQVSGYNGAVSEQPYTLRVKVTPQVPSPQCSPRSWLVGGATSTVAPVGIWTLDTNAVFLVNGARLAASEGTDFVATEAADAALTAINNLVNTTRPGITDGVVVDVSTIPGVDYTAWDANPCDVDAANAIVNAITNFLELQRVGSPDLAYVTIVGSDEIIPFARKPDETSIANESTFAGEFFDNAMFGALVTRHFLSDDTYGDIDPIAWLDRYLNVPELGVGRLVESAGDIQTAAENYIASAGILDPQTALSAGYDFIADASEEIDDTFNIYSPAFGFDVEPALIDQPDIFPESNAWDKSDFLNATGISGSNAVDLVSFNMHFDFDEALPSIGDATGNYTDNLINTTDLAGADLTGGIWFTVGCHSGSSVADVSVVGAAPSEDWAQTFSRLGALYLAQNAYGLGDTEAVALTERLMVNFARNLNGSLSIGQAHAFAKQQYFADLGLYGEYDYKALQAATLFGLPMYQYGNGAMVVDTPPPPLPVAADPLSGLTSASWSLSDTGITQTTGTSKGDLFSVDGEVQFVHFRPLQPIVRRDVTGPSGEVASGAFLTSLVTEDVFVSDIAFARPVIDLGKNELEIEFDEGVFPTAFTNIASFKAPPPTGGPFEPRQQLNVIVGQFTSPRDGSSSGTERLFDSFDAQVFYRTAATATAAVATVDDFIRPEFDNVQASVVGSGGTQQAAFSVNVFDEGTVLRVAVLYLQSVSVADGKGNWVLVDLVQGGGSNTWTGGGPVDLTGVSDGQIDYMVQAVDANGNVANSTFKGLFYVAEELDAAPERPGPDTPPGVIGVVVSVDGDEKDPGDWISTDPVNIDIVNLDPDITYVYSVDFAPFVPLDPMTGFVITEDGVHIVTVQESDGSNPVTFVILIDTTLPNVVITTPAEGEFIVQGQEPAASFDCLDAGSGIATCVGEVPGIGTASDGDPVPSATIGSHTFVVTAQDYAHLNDDPPSPTVVDQNAYYVVKPIVVNGPINPTATNEPVAITTSATDLPEFDETATIDWGDGSPVLEVNDLSNISGSHDYLTPDVYQITVTVSYRDEFTNDLKFTQIGVLDFVVIYDPSGGFVTGGGWFDSPPNAYTPNVSSDPYVTGKAHFGFVSKYKKGQSVPDGSTNFRFAAGNLEFDATAYDWMIISGAHARYKGEGTVNGSAELYKFQVTALDADFSGNGITQDGFRIKIWRDESGDTENVLYDNGLGGDDATGTGGTTPLGGGSIKVHKAK